MESKKRKRSWFMFPFNWCFHKGFWSGITVFWAHDKRYTCEEAEVKIPKYKAKILTL